MKLQLKWRRTDSIKEIQTVSQNAMKMLTRMTSGCASDHENHAGIPVSMQKGTTSKRMGANRNFADYITPCSKSDPNFNQCALEHGREAIPKILKGDRKYGVPNLDPLFVKEVHVNEFGFAVTMRDMTVERMKDADLQDIRVDFDKLIISFSLHLPVLLFRGKYEMSGRLLNLPIAGKGDFSVSMVDVTVKYKTFCNLTKKSDGQTYLQPVDYELRLEPKSGSVSFGNLFNGNKLLGDTMNNFLNENFLLVAEEIGQPVYRALGMIVHQIMVGFLEKVPYNELFPMDK